MQTPFSILSVLTVGENALNISYLSLEHQKMYWGNACAEYWVTEQLGRVPTYDERTSNGGQK